jgi:alcohol dehydrogenase (cytochrome c)
LLFKQYCMQCHGLQLQGSGELGPPLVGSGFDGKWAGKPVSELLQYIETTMPPGNAGIMKRDGYRDLLAYIFSERKLAAGADLASDMKTLAQIHLPMPVVMRASRNTPFLPDPMRPCACRIRNR